MKVGEVVPETENRQVGSARANARQDVCSQCYRYLRAQPGNKVHLGICHPEARCTSFKFEGIGLKPVYRFYSFWDIFNVP